MLKRVTVITGRDRVGKTTTCKYLAEKYNGKVISFGSKLRKEMKEIYGLTDEDLQNKTKEVIMGNLDCSPEALKLFLKHNLVESPYYFNQMKVTIRDLYNIHGTKIRRMENFSYWSDVVKKEIQEFDGYVFIDDARAEADFNTCDEFENSKFFLYNEPFPKLTDPRNVAEELMINYVKSNRDNIVAIKIGIPADNYVKYAEACILKMNEKGGEST